MVATDGDCLQLPAALHCPVFSSRPNGNPTQDEQYFRLRWVDFPTSGQTNDRVCLVVTNTVVIINRQLHNSCVLLSTRSFEGLIGSYGRPCYSRIPESYHVHYSEEHPP